MSSPEDLLAWQITVTRLPAPVRNHRFHRTRNWEIDFAWPDRKLGIEIDGGIWSGGRTSKDGRGAHSRPAAILRDMAKHNALLDYGWRVYRVPTGDVRTGRVLQLVQAVLEGDVCSTTTGSAPSEVLSLQSLPKRRSRQFSVRSTG